ncbi:ABC transporter permease [candidate division FCPU426 bacterium]|nr:ABC transporter permease [candidate division FCPU426 bacterium]
MQYLMDLISVVTRKDLQVRYKSYVLGYLWSLANPLAFAFVFWVAFKVVMRIQMEAYALFLIAGLFPWQWFSNSVNVNANVFLMNASIIKKVNFPRNVLPFSMVLQDMLHFLMSIPVILLFMLMYQKPVGWVWLYGIPALVIVQFIFCYGLALLVSSLNLFFRDLERIINLLTTLMFYFTPIIYPLEMVPGQFKQVIYFNPLTSLIVGWREVLLNNTFPTGFVLLSLLYGLLALGLGLVIYKKLSWKFAEVL